MAIANRRGMLRTENVSHVSAKASQGNPSRAAVDKKVALQMLDENNIALQMPDENNFCNEINVQTFNQRKPCTCTTEAENLCTSGCKREQMKFNEHSLKIEGRQIIE